MIRATHFFEADPDEIIRKHSRSFYLASLFLPRRIRKDVCKLYAWCRWCDDAIDRAPSSDVGRRCLEAIVSDLSAMEQGRRPGLDASQSLLEVLTKHRIPIRLCRDLVEGMLMDARGEEVRTTKDLLRYSYHAAGSVGLMMCRLLGAEDVRAELHAKSLGMAMQLTNIARDVGEDFRLGRCYIPTDWLSDEKLTRDGTKPHVRRILRLAETHYQAGFDGLQYLPPSCRLSIRIAASVYREIGSVIRENSYDSISQRAVVPTSRKTKVVIRSLIQVFLSALSDCRFRRPNSSFYCGAGTMKSDSKFVVYLGLSLTLVTATALFVLVGINPKQPTYGFLPWLYAGSSALGALFFGGLAKKYENRVRMEPVSIASVEHRRPGSQKPQTQEIRG